MNKCPQSFNYAVAEQQVMTTAQVLKKRWRMKTKKESHSWIYPVSSQVWSPSQKPKTRGIIVWGLLTPRWLVFLFPALAEGQSTSGAARKRKKKLSLSGRCSRRVGGRAKPRNKTNQFEARQLSSSQPEQNLFFFFQELSSAVLDG